MRVILDTNVVLSALLWRGTPYRLLQAIRGRELVQLFSSPALLQELAEILIRPVPAKRLAVLGLTPRQVLADYVDAVELVTPLSAPRVVANDADDDQVIAAALEAGADLLVSGDRDVLSIRNYADIPIVTAAEAVAILDR